MCRIKTLRQFCWTMSNCLASSAFQFAPLRLWRSASPPTLSQWQSLTHQRVDAPHITTLWMVPECPVCQMPSGGGMLQPRVYVAKVSLPALQAPQIHTWIDELIMSDVSDPNVWLKLAIDLNHDLIAWLYRFPNIDSVAVWEKVHQLPSRFYDFLPSVFLLTHC